MHIVSPHFSIMSSLNYNIKIQLFITYSYFRLLKFQYPLIINKEKHQQMIFVSPESEVLTTPCYLKHQTNKERTLTAYDAQQSELIH